MTYPLARTKSITWSPKKTSKDDELLDYAHGNWMQAKPSVTKEDGKCFDLSTKSRVYILFKGKRSLSIHQARGLESCESRAISSRDFDFSTWKINTALVLMRI